MDSTTRPIYSNAINIDSQQRWVPLSVVFFTFLHLHNQNDDDGSMHAIFIDKLQRESLIWTHEPTDDKQQMAGMSSNYVGNRKGGGWGALIGH